MHERVDSFLRALEDSPPNAGIFNPWYQRDREHGIGPAGPKIRRQQLVKYLEARLASARWLLIGEAIGYQGGHFSGLAMTSERILLGHKVSEGIPPEQVLAELEPQRTSDPKLRAKGFSEPTATIVWKTMLPLGVAGEQFVLWNAFAWHPFDPAAGRLSNRRPKADELEWGRPQLAEFLRLFPEALPIAVGRVAESELEGLLAEVRRVRHPAHGGASQFRRQMRALLAMD